MTDRRHLANNQPNTQTLTREGPLAPSALTARDVLMVAPTMFFADYGCHVRILEESLSLRDLGHQLRILAYPNGRDVAGFQVRRCPGVPFNYRVIVGSNRHKIYLDAMLGLTALHEALKQPPEVIHAHLHEGALIGHALSMFRASPMLFDFQGSLTAEMLDHGFVRPGGMRLRFWRWVEKTINQLPSAIITSSTHAADLLIREFGMSSERIFPILDSVNTDTFRPRTPGDEADLLALRQSLGIPEGRHLVLYLGLLAEYQGTDLLLQAAQYLLQKRDDVHFLIMGFPREAQYMQMAQGLGIAAHTTFTGRLPYDQAARFLRLGDVAVAPKMSSTEGSGKILNYMAVGLPTVAFDTPVSREYLGHWGNYATEQSPVAFANKLNNLLDNGHEWATVGNALRNRVQKNFSWRGAGQQISEIYDLICE
ncbi:MAG: glycosyltransferase family 4 protein [Ardenticatenales bacterium]|nr:glycosyltransferase family 4 protein [Ardenticatenales bacterium]